MIEKSRLAEHARELGLSLSEEQLWQFDRYCELLLEWNQKINLTAIRDPEGVLIKHFVDSLALLKYAPLPQGAKLIDVGTGAGFPGVPLKLARPDLSLTLLDSLNKRLLFLQELSQQLSFEAEITHSRAEEAGRLPTLRERFDTAVSRAVASLNLLAEYCLPFVKVGGVFLAAKGPEVEEELAQGERAVKLLGGRIEKIERYQLPEGSGRTLVVIRKEKPTSGEYPRHGSKISKKPL